MRSQNCSASLMMWVEKMMVLPSSRNWPISLRISSALSTSKSDGGLVENQHRRVVGNRAGDRHLLFHALGEAFHAGIGIFRNPEALDEFVRRARARDPRARR